MPSPAQVLAVAASQVGVKESPPGSNRTPYCDWYGMVGPWCAMFVSWVFAQAGMPLRITTDKGFAYCPYGVHWFREHGQMYRAPAVGDVVFYDWRADGVSDHVGIVEAVHGDGTFTAIEGNTSFGNDSDGGAVMRRRRSLGATRAGGGFGRPNYALNSSPTPGGLVMPETIRRGARGLIVRILQGLLVAHGHRVTVDGDFGPGSEAAVRAFQAGRGLGVDGIVGPNTWQSLVRPV